MRPYSDTERGCQYCPARLDDKWIAFGADADKARRRRVVVQADCIIPIAVPCDQRLAALPMPSAVEMLPVPTVNDAVLLEPSPGQARSRQPRGPCCRAAARTPRPLVRSPSSCCRRGGRDRLWRRKLRWRFQRRPPRTQMRTHQSRERRRRPSPRVRDFGGSLRPVLPELTRLQVFRSSLLRCHLDRSFPQWSQVALRHRNTVVTAVTKLLENFSSSHRTHKANDLITSSSI